MASRGYEASIPAGDIIFESSSGEQQSVKFCKLRGTSASCGSNRHLAHMSPRGNAEGEEGCTIANKDCPRKALHTNYR